MTDSGKIEFSPGEDAHVIADCVKVSTLRIICVFLLFAAYGAVLFIDITSIFQYFIRELPSSPVPASCCNALLEARRKSAVEVFVLTICLWVFLCPVLCNMY